MSTDITIEAAPARVPVSFDGFVQDDLALIAKAVAVSLDNAALTADALTAALRSAYANWSTHTVSDAPDEHVFATAIDFAITERTAREGDGHEPSVLASACACAHHGLGWSTEQIARVLKLTSAEVNDQLATASTTAFDAEASELQLGIRVHEQMKHAAPRLPDIWRIKADERKTLQRDRRAKGVVLALGAILGLVLIAQLISRPGRTAAVEPATEPPAATLTQPTPRASEAPTEPGDTGSDDTARPPAQTTSAGAAAGVIGTEPRPDLSPFPDLITTDGTGGFVGVRSPTAQDPRVVFTRSTNGQSWSLASRWNLGNDVTIERIERSGPHFVVWIGGAPATSEAVVGTIGVSTDLIAWTVLELATEDGNPAGLLYTPTITDVSVNEFGVLALVRTAVEIDFDALLLSEGYTCGQTIEQDEVTVDLCNGSFDVLSVSDIEQLPDRSRLFVSRLGLPFVEVDAPFGPDTPARLAQVSGEFAVTDEAGVRFALSSDATNWRTITAGKAPFAIDAAATNEKAELAGLGRFTSGTPMVFFLKEAEVEAQPVEELIGDLPPTLDAVVASAPWGWAVYLFDGQSNAWLLTSGDGRRWQVRPASGPIDAEPRLLVGDNEALVQWLDNDGSQITLGIPLD